MEQRLTAKLALQKSITTHRCEIRWKPNSMRQTSDERHQSQYMMSRRQLRERLYPHTNDALANTENLSETQRTTSAKRVFTKCLNGSNVVPTLKPVKNQSHFFFFFYYVACAPCRLLAPVGSGGRRRTRSSSPISVVNSTRPKLTSSVPPAYAAASMQLVCS